MNTFFQSSILCSALLLTTNALAQSTTYTSSDGVIRATETMRPNRQISADDTTYHSADDYMRSWMATESARQAKTATQIVADDKVVRTYLPEMEKQATLWVTQEPAWKNDFPDPAFNAQIGRGVIMQTLYRDVGFMTLWDFGTVIFKKMPDGSTKWESYPFRDYGAKTRDEKMRRISAQFNELIKKQCKWLQDKNPSLKCD